MAKSQLVKLGDRLVQRQTPEGLEVAVIEVHADLDAIVATLTPRLLASVHGVATVAGGSVQLRVIKRSIVGKGGE